jgi:hypothetical protein
VSLGSLGVLASLTIKAVPAFNMKKTTVMMPLELLLDQHDYLYDK